MGDSDKNSEGMPSIIAYKISPSETDLIESNPDQTTGSVGRFRAGTKFYPIGETVTYYVKTKERVPVLWFATEKAIEEGADAPALTVKISEQDLCLALTEPHKWEMLCLKCEERTQLKSFLDTGKWNTVDFTELFCPWDNDTQMVLKRI